MNEQAKCKWCGSTETWEWCSENHRKEHIEALLLQVTERDEFSNGAIADLFEILLGLKEKV